MSLVFISQKQSKEEGRITIDDHDNFLKKDCDKYLLLGLWQVMAFSFVFVFVFFHNIAVVVQFYPWFKFIFFCFLVW